MPHIHELIDWVVSAFIVNPEANKVLLVHHRKLNGWYAVGGHIELHETSDEALDREINEETGLTVGKDVMVVQSTYYSERWRAWRQFKNNPQHSIQLRRPWAMEIHDFPPVHGHRHIAMVYLCIASTLDVKLEEDAHYGIRWFSHEELDELKTGTLENIRWYGHRALDAVKGKAVNSYVAQRRSSELHPIQPHQERTGGDADLQCAGGGEKCHSNGQVTRSPATSSATDCEGTFKKPVQDSSTL
jgi:8-oxo-dGTP pyrophosphatase MutT (NUDIX family)